MVSSKIEHDDRAWGCGVLVCLRDHLCTTHDAQSIQWMLPHVEAALQRFCSPTPHNHERKRCRTTPSGTHQVVSHMFMCGSEVYCLVCQACGPRAHDVEGLYLVPMGAA